MDVQLSTVAPAATSKAASSSGNAAAADTGSKDFTQVLGGQLGQGETLVDSKNGSDPALSIGMLLQMLQSLIMPVQGAPAAPVEQGAEGEQAIPELLLQAMNGNSGLCNQLLQDPKVKKWFEEAGQLLNSLGDPKASSAFPLTNTLNLQATDTLNLQAQNTLLTLATLSQQQPDNPIVQYLNQGLQTAIQPLLPELLSSMKVATAADATETATSAEAVEGIEENTGSGNKAVGFRDIHKRAHKPANEQRVDVDTSLGDQPSKSKLELLAVKNVLAAPISTLHSEAQEAFVPLEDFPTEANATSNQVVTISDLQKTQLAQPSVEKTAPVINAANFTEEMTEHVLKNMKITMANGISEAKLSLFPKNLGRIDVRISMQDGQLIALFAADSAAGKQMLESQLPQLRHTLQTQGLQVEKLEVTQNQNMSSSMFQDQRQGQPFNQSQRQGKNHSGNYDGEAGDFNQEIESFASARKAVNGNSFDVIA